MRIELSSSSEDNNSMAVSAVLVKNTVHSEVKCVSSLHKAVMALSEWQSTTLHMTQQSTKLARSRTCAPSCSATSWRATAANSSSTVIASENRR